MNYLLAEHITKIYGDKVLFENINFSINKGEKIALLAKNGTGKTSLLRILVGLDASDQQGTVRISREAKLAYLDQEPNLNNNHSVFEAVYAVDTPILQTIRRYEETLHRHETQPTPSTQKQLEQAMEAMNLVGGWDYDTRIKEILFRFSIHDMNRSVAALSGGERKRLALAILIINEPDFLILDEPTNHLDLALIEWLEEYLSRPNLTLLIVTHDRYFLNNVTQQIVELEYGKLQVYRGNYEYYLERKAELDFNLRQETDKAQKLMKKELAWLRTQPKARTTKAKSRIDNFDNIQEKASKKINDDTTNFAGLKTAYIGSKIIELYHVSKSYGEQVLLREFNYLFRRRDRVGIVGKNGVGKTTLLNLIAGLEQPDAGQIVRGQTVVIGYYTQSGLDITEDKKLIDVVQDIAEYLPMEKGKVLTAGQLLDHFQFPYSKHHHYISTLSGGEKRRLHLLTVLMRNPNFLILDEPTNDLDILTLNVLEDFLATFEGCLIIVSHDRYFMDKLVEHVFALEGDGSVRDYPGNYTRYREARDIEEVERRQKAEQQRQQQSLNSPISSDAQAKVREKRKLSFNEQREFNQLSTEIDLLAQERKKLEEQLSMGAANHAELLQWSNRIAEIIDLLDEKEMRWLELSEYA